MCLNFVRREISKEFPGDYDEKFKQLTNLDEQLRLGTNASAPRESRLWLVPGADEVRRGAHLLIAQEMD